MSTREYLILFALFSRRNQDKIFLLTNASAKKISNVVSTQVNCKDVHTGIKIKYSVRQSVKCRYMVERTHKADINLL